MSIGHHGGHSSNTCRQRVLWSSQRTNAKIHLAESTPQAICDLKGKTHANTLIFTAATRACGIQLLEASFSPQFLKPRVHCLLSFSVRSSGLPSLFRSSVCLRHLSLAGNAYQVFITLPSWRKTALRKAIVSDTRVRSQKENRKSTQV